MNIIERGPCQRHAAGLSPIKPWGVLLHTTEGGSKSSLDELFIKCRRYDGIVNGQKHYTTVSVQFAVYSDGEVRSYAPWRPGQAWYCYHAGNSYLDGQSGVSRVLLGIEIQHKEGQAFPAVQIAALKELLATIQAAYRGQPYWRNVLTEHSIVSPGRKIDPTAPWSKVKAEVYAAWNGQEDEDMTEDEVRRLARDEIGKAQLAAYPPDEQEATEALDAMGLLSKAHKGTALINARLLRVVLHRALKQAKR